jgi:hypothetical protein
MIAANEACSVAYAVGVVVPPEDSTSIGPAVSHTPIVNGGLNPVVIVKTCSGELVEFKPKTFKTLKDSATNTNAAITFRKDTNCFDIINTPRVLRSGRRTDAFAVVANGTNMWNFKLFGKFAQVYLIREIKQIEKAA